MTSLMIRACAALILALLFAGLRLVLGKEPFWRLMGALGIIILAGFIVLVFIVAGMVLVTGELPYLF